MAITQAITAHPEPAPNKDTQTASAFQDACDEHLEWLLDYVGEVNTWGEQANALATEVNDDAATASAAATTATEQAELATTNGAAQVALASTHAQTAAANAQFVGQWSTLTGDLTVPASTYHAGAYWMLLSDLADVTTSEPGESADWAPVYASISIDGPGSAYITATVEFVITDYDSASSYTVSAARGSASITDENISYTAPSTEGAGTDTLTVTKNGVPRNLEITINPAGVATPTWTGPSTLTGIIPGEIFTLSDFTKYGPDMTHIETDWEFATDSEFVNVVISSLADTSNLTSWVPTGWEEATTYYGRARHRASMDGTKLESAWTATLTVTTADAFSGLIGTPGEQGFGIGICPDAQLPTGLTGLTGYNDITADNYGNYQFSDGSIMGYVPKFYYRINDDENPVYAEFAPNDIDVVNANTFASRDAAALVGYALPRAFIDGGVEKDGVFVDKYMCSKHALGTGYVASSIKDGLPLSSADTHNPVADLTAISENLNASFVDAAHARDGADGAINSASIFFCKTRFITAMLALLSMAHGQASTSTTYCAWYGATRNYPKGCNDNSLHDVDDVEVTYIGDGYDNCGKTGSGTPFAKTTHNGQACGIADLNGLMYEVDLGLTRPGTSATDTTAQDNAADFYVLKESVEARTLTGGFGGTNDAWGDATHLATLYDQTTISHISAGATANRFGSGTNQVLDSATTGAGWLLTSLGFPKDADAKDSTGTDLFGNDYFYEKHQANLCVLSCSYWGHAAYAGVWACSLNYYRSRSNNYHGFRCACYPENAA